VRLFNVTSPAPYGYFIVSPKTSFDHKKVRKFRIWLTSDGVVDDDGMLRGIVNYEDMNGALLSPDDQDRPTKVGDLAHSAGDILTVVDSLEQAMRLLDGSDRQSVAVVASRDSMLLRGTVNTLDVTRAHNDALLSARADEHA